jgi:hypothetical protein
VKWEGRLFVLQALVRNRPASGSITVNVRAQAGWPGGGRSGRAGTKTTARSPLQRPYTWEKCRSNKAVRTGGARKLPGRAAGQPATPTAPPLPQCRFNRAGPGPPSRVNTPWRGQNFVLRMKR